ncbi:hypothetical protein [Suttonella indologenes]|uniref:Uncharacterized protein n=1 Tax=Suttonella indologenes TaxID=13276 RepID=A0A380N439_9GAMM|nr:hypothetical protein [Suttonella indologenes]SUO98607.1 Uncharacterised protein [Suttonella indologenes]
MAGVGMMIVLFMLIIGAFIYLLFSFFISKGLTENKRRQLLYFALFLLFPLLIGMLNYYGFCFKKMRFLNEQDIYTILDNSKYKEQSNDYYGAYIFTREKMYGNFETDLEGGHLYEDWGTFLEKILGWRYARVQTKRSSFIMTNCGNLYPPEF